MPRPRPALGELPHSGIREIVDLALASAVPLVRLEIGEPDFATPAHIVDAAADAARRGSSYVQAAGMPTVRDAAAASVRRRYDLDISADRVLVSHGAVHAIDSVIRALITPGDGVLIPDPAWPNYEMQALLAGGRVQRYPVRAERGYVPDPDDIRRALTADTRIIVINSPSNPTGAVAPREVIEQIIAIAIERDILVLSDEVYDEIIFDGAPTCAAALAPDHAVSVYSTSKTYAMTGWRVGYALVPTWLTDPLTRVLEASISCLSSVTQAAALAALTGDQTPVAAMRDAYRARRDLAVGLLEDAGIPTRTPGGAFYLMMQLAPGVDARLTALDLVERGVATAPGTAFGTEASGSLRLSLATSENALRTGIGILSDWYSATGGGLETRAAVRV
ncbi:aminotransferase class I/II-fold pyridoxal phosphate-dependent enzyme [Microbacterium sp. NPDC076895]|uniref:pyridoxal phosphate-dependent aminotransferase n=1 Tax=Microbacterium sp. NPDC076895 TaxID=3154957 RepID=UPI003428CB10